MPHSLKAKWNDLTKSKTTKKAIEIQKAGCGHALHPVCSPADLDHCPYCPCCHINNILRDLNRVSKEWREEGGPYAKVASPHYKAGMECYRLFRTELANYMWQLRLCSEKEHVWDTKNPGSLADLYIGSAKTALAIANRSIPFCDILEDDFGRKAKSAGKKQVRFVDGVQEESPTRPTGYMQRTSGFYKPGRWAAPVGKPWLDTSFRQDQWYGNLEYERELDRRWLEG